MLTLYMNRDYENELWSPSSYFDYELDPEFLSSDFTKKVIQTIDNSEWISENMVKSPILGNIRIEDISGGAKTLIVLNHVDNIIVSTTRLGRNCIPLLEDIANRKDIVMTSEYPLMFSDNFTFTVGESGEIIKGFDSYTKAFGEYHKWDE